MWGYCRWVERICKTFKKKTKLTICKYFKHVWKCFVWHRDAHWEIIYRRRVGVFRLRFNDHRDLTNTQERKCQIWHPSTDCVCSKTDVGLVESRVICRLSEVIYQTDEGALRLISGHEKWNTNHQWESFIQYPAPSGNIQNTSGISRHKVVFKTSCDPFSLSISMFRNIGWNTSFIAGAFWYSSSNNQLYSSFREIHSSKFEKCYDDQYSISFFLLHALLTSFRDAT